MKARLSPAAVLAATIPFLLSVAGLTAGLAPIEAVSLARASLVSSSDRAPEPSATDVARALQQKYDGVKDFSSDFAHVYRGGVLKKQLVAKGRLFIKKPGKMRWEYTEPEEKLFVSDGTKLYSYIPQDKQVIVSSVPQDDSAPVPTLFLAGKGNLMRDFSVSFDETTT